LATRSRLPLGVKTTASGPAPVGAVATTSPSRSSRSTLPGSVSSSACTATATRPSPAATLVTSEPYELRSTRRSSAGAAGFDTSTTSTAAAVAFDTNIRLPCSATVSALVPERPVA